MSREPSAAEKMIGNFAPKLVELTDDVLFGDIGNAQSFQSVIVVWSRWRR